MEEGEDRGAVNASIRSAKRAARPSKIGVLEHRPSKTRKERPKVSKRKTKIGGGSFDQDMGQRTKTEGTRAKKGDSIGRIGKHKNI